MGQKSGHLEEDILMTRSLSKDAPNYMLTELKIKTHLTEWSKSTTLKTPNVASMWEHGILTTNKNVKLVQPLWKAVW